MLSGNLSMSPPPSSSPVSGGGRRSRRSHFSNPGLMTTGVEIHGHAYLYFSDTYSWFQGSINTDGESNYSICGETADSDTTASSSNSNPKSKLQFSSSSSSSISSTATTTPEESDEDLESSENQNIEGHLIGLETDSDSQCSSLDLSSKGYSEDDPQYYRVTLTDHYTGLIYNFHKVIINRHATRSDESLLLCFDPNIQIQFKTENVYKGQKAAMVIQRSLGSSALLGKQCIVYSGEIHLQFSDDYIVSGRDWNF